MASRMKTMPEISLSVIHDSASGQMPNPSRVIVSRPAGIMSPTSGRASRLVRMKYCGKLPKYTQAKGPVVSWQAIDMHAEVHIHLIGLSMKGYFPFFHNPLSRGNIYAIPAMAAYES